MCHLDLLIETENRENTHPKGLIEFKLFEKINSLLLAY